MPDEVLLDITACEPGQKVVAVVTLNRPSSKNALNKALSHEFARVLDGLRRRPDIGACVVTGSNHCFSSGVDLKDPVFSDVSMVSRNNMIGPSSYFWQLQEMVVPLIAAVSGPCMTGGMEIALNCDIIIADETAVFRDTHCIYGIRPAGGMTQLLPRAVGLHAAKYMSLSACPITAQRAYELGLVSEVVASDKLLSRAISLGKSISKMSAKTLQAVKGMHHAGGAFDVGSALRYELNAALESYAQMASSGQMTSATLGNKFAARSKL